MKGDKPDFGGPFVWQPTSEYIKNAHLTHFIHRYGLSDFQELMDCSTSDVGWFTKAVLEYLDICFYIPYAEILDVSGGKAWPRWCVGGTMNIVHNCLDKYIGTPAESRIALRWEGEEGTITQMSYLELFNTVNKVASVLRSLGMEKGDCIGIFMPMTPEIVVALLAIVKIGAVALPLFSGFGTGAIAARLADAEAKCLFTADGSLRRGKIFPMKVIADLAAAEVPTIKHMIVMNRVNIEVSIQAGRDIAWSDLATSELIDTPTEHTQAEDTLMILYTSGTSGKPKGIVHTHCGFPIKAAQDMAFGTDLHPGQTIHWMTDMGWMMGPWQVFGTLILGGTLLIYDGTPDYPSPERMWSLVERHNVNILGVSPTLIRSLSQFGSQHALNHDLSSLRFFASTGEPWNPDPWLWLFETIGGSRIPIINYSGGTEISGGILMGNPLLPLKPCAFSAPCPGIAADILDENGESIRNQVGELVIKAPWIGMARGFWKDSRRYENTYWSRWPGIWVHGDFAIIDEDGQWFILGRSDDTIKVAGKRVGPAELESILVSHSAVVEAAVIGVPDELKGNEIVAFCVVKENITSSDALRLDLVRLVVRSMGKSLAPQKILFVKDLPKTRNAKIMRRVIRAAYLDQDLGDIGSLVNPDSVKEIRHLSSLDN